VNGERVNGERVTPVAANEPGGVTRIGSRSVELDLWRGLAALAVVVSHVAFATGVVNPLRWSSSLRLVLPRLDVGVPIFFVLSGLLVGGPFVRALAGEGKAPPLGRYAARRITRIYPLYWLVLAVVILANQPMLERWSFLRFVTLTHIYRPSSAIGPITQSWSLATELSFYVLLPVWVWGVRRLAEWRGIEPGKARVVLLLWSLVTWPILSLLWRAGILAATHTFDYTKPGAVDVRGAYLTWLPNHLDTFAVGIAFAAFGVLRPKWFLALTRPSVRIALLAVAAVSLWAASDWLGLPPLHTGFDGPQTFARHGLFVLIAACVIAPAASAFSSRRVATTADQVERSAFARGWERLAVGAGIASYGVYLWHQQVTTEWIARPPHKVFQTAFPTALFVVVIGAVALAGVGYWLLERWPPRAVEWLSAIGPTTKPNRLGEIAAFDGLRGVALIGVLLVHLAFLMPGHTYRASRGFFVGVDVFLVLSAFLITASLVTSVDTGSPLSARAFARRRTQRILPALIVFFLGYGVVSTALGQSIRETLLQAVLSFGFISNLQLVVHHQPPFDLVHLWTVAFEGQMYVLLFLGVWWARTRLAKTAANVTALVVAACGVTVWQMFCSFGATNPEAMYERTDLRLGTTILGCAAALVWRSNAWSTRVLRTVGVVGAAAVAAGAATLSVGGMELYRGGLTVVDAGAAALVCALAGGGIWWMQRVMCWTPLRWFGRISYSVYLWHLPCYVWTAKAFPTLSLVPRFALAVTAATTLGALSYRFVESAAFARREPARSK
jgi:peptidoglycan/LPS O-acetylase OafA/YrhL